MARRRKKFEQLYVVARGSKGRPTCQHKTAVDPSHTACGADLTGWSRQFTEMRLEAILCRRRKCQEE